MYVLMSSYACGLDSRLDVYFDRRKTIDWYIPVVSHSVTDCVRVSVRVRRRSDHRPGPRPMLVTEITLRSFLTRSKATWLSG